MVLRPAAEQGNAASGQQRLGFTGQGRYGVGAQDAVGMAGRLPGQFSQRLQGGGYRGTVRQTGQ